MVDHIDRVIGAGDARARRHVRSANRSGDQNSAARQQLRDLRHRVGFARQEERKRRLRPDQNGGVAHASAARAGGTIRQRQILAHHLRFGRVIEAHVLLQIGLHDAQLDAGDRSGRGGRQPQRAERRHQHQGQQPRHRRQPAPIAFGTIIDQHRGAGEDRHAEERQSPQPEHRGILRERQRLGQRVAERVPGKAGEQMAAQPFAGGQADRQRQHARAVSGPQQPCQRKAERGE